MQDLASLVALTACCALAALYVVGCRRITGFDEKALSEEQGRTASADDEPDRNGGRLMHDLACIIIFRRSHLPGRCRRQRQSRTNFAGRVRAGAAANSGV